MKTITKLCFLFFFLASAQLATAQWFDAGSYVRLNSSADDVHIGASTAPGSKLRVTDSNISGETVDFNCSGNLVAGADLLNLTVTAGSSNDAEVIEVNKGGSSTFHLYANGKANLIEGSNGIALEVNGAEALWADADNYSWGFGKDYSYWANEMVIGQSLIPNEGDGLTIGNSEDLRLEGSGTRLVRFTDAGTQESWMGMSGNNMFVRNDNAAGDLYLDGQIDLYLQTGSSTRMTVKATGDIGVGTTTPEAKMHIHKAAGTYTGAAGSIATLLVEDDGFNTIMMNGGNTWNGLVFSDNSNAQYAGMYYNKSTDDIMFKCGGADNRMTITNEGDVGIGDSSPDAKFEVAGGLILNEGTTTQVTGASATQLVERTDGAAMLFGAGNNAGFTIDEDFDFQVRSRPRANVLARSLSGGLYLFVSNGTNGNSAFGYSNAAGATHRVRVNGSIQATAFAPPSDRKLKKDVNPFEIGLAAVNKINPVTYVYNGVAGIECDATQVGMMAQDLQKIAPVLVQEETYYENNEKTGKAEAKDTYLSINDTGIKYILINAIKELSDDVDAKDERIEALEATNTELQEGYDALNDRLNKLEALLNNDSDNTVTGKLNPEKNVVINGEGTIAELAQNQPNPFSENTTINYFLPEGTTGAEMNIFSIEGKLLKSVKIDEAGSGQINLKANSLPAGTYSYQLTTDTGIVGSKSMVLIK